jgi:hypothetical protein
VVEEEHEHQRVAVRPEPSSSYQHPSYNDPGASAVSLAQPPLGLLGMPAAAGAAGQLVMAPGYIPLPLPLGCQFGYVPLGGGQLRVVPISYVTAAGGQVALSNGAGGGGQFGPLADLSLGRPQSPAATQMPPQPFYVAVDTRAQQPLGMESTLEIIPVVRFFFYNEI